jgi:hypothetical protein
MRANMLAVHMGIKSSQGRLDDVRGSADLHNGALHTIYEGLRVNTIHNRRLMEPNIIDKQWGE